MAKTLVIKLAETVDDSNLPYLGELRFETFKTGRIVAPTIISGEDVTVEIFNGDSDAHFTDSTGAENYGKKMTLTAGSRFYVSDSNANVRLYPKYKVNTVLMSAQHNVRMNIAQLYGCTMLQYMEAGYANGAGTNIYGDIAALRGMNTLFVLRIQNCSNIYGDIEVLSTLSQLRDSALNGNSISGDISAIKDMSSLGTLWLNDSHNITGDTSSIANLHPNNGGRLATFGYGGTQITGTWPPSA